MHSSGYEVVVKGTLSGSLVLAIESGQSFTVSHTANGTTHLVGWIQDQARLYGLLHAVERLAIELISVNPVPNPPNRKKAIMATGPVEYIVVAFPGNEFSGDIVPALTDLVASGTVRILDLVFVGKDAGGHLVSFEIEDVPSFADLDADVGGLISTVDIEHAAAALPANTSAALLIWEDVWAAPFAEAVRNAGGLLVEGARIPADDVEDALAALPAAV